MANPLKQSVFSKPVVPKIDIENMGKKHKLKSKHLNPSKYKPNEVELKYIYPNEPAFFDSKK